MIIVIFKSHKAFLFIYMRIMVSSLCRPSVPFPWRDFNEKDDNEMAKIPKSDQSQNTSREYKSEK
jgi:hypothetical protein